MIKKFYSESVCTSHVRKQLRQKGRNTLRLGMLVALVVLIQSFGSAGENVKTLLLQRCAFPKFHLIEGLNARDQIAFYVFHSFLVEFRECGLHTCRACVIGT